MPYWILWFFFLKKHCNEVVPNKSTNIEQSYTTPSFPNIADYINPSSSFNNPQPNNK